jgi:hypothetical protein
MSFINNNVYICNLDQEIIKHNKFFQHNIVPVNVGLSVGEFPRDTRFNETIYSREHEIIPSLPLDNSPLTRATLYNKNVDKESHLHNTVIKNNNSNVNSYIPSNKSDLYTLNVPYHKQSGKHDLLFQIPQFSNSCTAPVYVSSSPFNSSTRLERENI